MSATWGILKKLQYYFNWEDNNKLMSYYKTKHCREFYKPILGTLVQDIAEGKCDVFLINQILNELPPAVVSHMYIMAKNNELDEFAAFIKRAINKNV